jgi:hypothetical protein
MKGHIFGAASGEDDDHSEETRESVLRRFSGRLESVRLAVGRPSYAKLQAIVCYLRPSTISTVLRGKTNPTLDFVLHFVRACATFARRAGHPVSEELINEEAWRNSWLQVQRRLGELRRSTETGRHEPDGTGQAFSWAYHRLPPNSQAFFRVISLYLAPEFTLRAAAELLGIAEDTAIRQLHILIDAGLAEHAGTDYRIQDLLDGLSIDLPIQRDGRAATHCEQCMTRR